MSKHASLLLSVIFPQIFAYPVLPSFFHKRYFAVLPDQQQTITWHIAEPSLYLDQDYVFRELTAAFQTWENVSNLKFKYDDGPGRKKPISHIYIGFVRENQHVMYHNRNINCQFNGNNIIAHAYYPPIHEIHVRDTNGYFKIGRHSIGPSLFNTAVHEIGHILSLKHSATKTSVMYWAADLQRQRHKSLMPLIAEDVARVVQLYGYKRRVFGVLT